jgi:uncharacterized protein
MATHNIGMGNIIFWSMLVFGACSPVCADTENFYSRLVVAAKAQTLQPVTYDASYVRIGYPNGDVPADKGVCTDVLIRAYRKVGIDLQVRVHEDMQEAFTVYPRIWGMKQPDANIDHRRVPNLQTFFGRKGITLAISNDPDDYRPGDIVSWMLPGNRPHIGIVVNGISADSSRPLIIHNIGRGPQIEDMLFDFEITGHYRYPRN